MDVNRVTVLSIFLVGFQYYKKQDAKILYE